MRSTEQAGSGVQPSLVCPALASHQLKAFFFWEFEKKGRNRILAQVNMVYFSCQVTTQPILATGIGKDMPKRKPLTTPKETGPAIQASTFGSVC